MDVRPADILVMKKPHPCGSQTMYVIRAGMDFKLRCTGCAGEFMVPRNKIERRIKQIRAGCPGIRRVIQTERQERRYAG